MNKKAGIMENKLVAIIIIGIVLGVLLMIYLVASGNLNSNLDFVLGMF